MASLSGVTAASASGGIDRAGDRFSELSNEEFFNVLFTELQNQDPFEPQDSGALLEQLSSIRNIESQLSLQESMESLVRQNQLATSSSLIGKQIEGLDDNNDEISGVVETVSVTDEGVRVRLDNGISIDSTRITGVAAGDE